MSRREPPRPFDGHRVPRPPDSLMRRTLDAAAAVSPVVPEVTFWDRLWSSRGLRVAWSIVTLALLIAHVAVSLGGYRAVPRAVRVDPLDELREILKLPTADISSRAERLAMEQRASGPAKNAEPPAPSNNNEVSL